MTPSEIVDASQSVCSDYTDQYPTTRAVSYSRLDARQKEVFASLAGWDPDHFGMQDIVELLGSSTFRFAEVLRRPAASITDIFVERADGNSAWPRGRRVNIVPSDDIDGHDPPRALIRNYELILVGDDGFDRVKSLRVWYSPMPRPISVTGAIDDMFDEHVDLPSPWEQLLVWDLALDLIRRTSDLDRGVKNRAMQDIVSVHNQTLAEFESHVIRYAPRQSRFRRLRGGDPHDELLPPPSAHLALDFRPLV